MSVTKGLIAVGVIALLFFFGLTAAFARVVPPIEVENDKVNICHATSRESNPYEALRVADDGNWNGHEDHEGDFLYEGPVDSKDKPTKDGDDWCGENVPEEPVDVCPNIDGVQEALPEDKILDEQGNCVDIPEEEPKDDPVATPSAQPEGGRGSGVTELPATGGFNWWIIGGIVVLLGGAIALYQFRDRK